MFKILLCGTLLRTFSCKANEFFFLKLGKESELQSKLEYLHFHRRREKEREGGGRGIRSEIKRKAQLNESKNAFN